jgi:cation transport ATPase
LAVGTIPQLIVSLEEEHLAKTEAKWVVSYMRDKMGMQVCMITGDNKHTARKVAKHLGISMENTYSEAYPE